MGVLHGEASQQVYPTCCHLIVEGETKARQDLRTKMNMKVRLEVDKGWEATPWMGRSKTLGSDMGHGFGQPRVLARTSSCTSTHVACKRITRSIENTGGRDRLRCIERRHDGPTSREGREHGDRREPGQEFFKGQEGSKEEES